MIRDILIMLAAVAAVVAFAPKVSHGVNTPAQEAVDAPVTAALPARRPEGSLTPRGRGRLLARRDWPEAATLAAGANSRTKLVRRGRDFAATA